MISFHIVTAIALYFNILFRVKKKTSKKIYKLLPTGNNRLDFEPMFKKYGYQNLFNLYRQYTYRKLINEYIDNDANSHLDIKIFAQEIYSLREAQRQPDINFEFWLEDFIRLDCLNLIIANIDKESKEIVFINVGLKPFKLYFWQFFNLRNYFKLKSWLFDVICIWLIELILLNFLSMTIIIGISFIYSLALSNFMLFHQVLNFYIDYNVFL